MSIQETTAKTETANPKKAATQKKTAKATKAKGAAKPGSKAAIVLEMMKRKEGATLAENRQGDRLAESQYSRVRQRARHQETGTEG